MKKLLTLLLTATILLTPIGLANANLDRPRNGTYISVDDMLGGLLSQTWILSGTDDISLSIGGGLIKTRGTWTINGNRLRITSYLFGVETVSGYTITQITQDSFVIDGVLFVRQPDSYDDAPVEDVYIPVPAPSPELSQDDLITISFGGPEMTTIRREVLNVQVLWGDSMFDRCATEYNHQLAKAAMALSAAVYNTNQIEHALRAMGFSDIVHDGLNDDGNNPPDTVGFAISQRTVNNNGMEYDLVAVVLRGSRGALPHAITGSDWVSNMNIGFSQDHLGFTLAADRVFDALSGYVNQHHLGIDGRPTKFFITGHSRGAAVANLLAARLNQDSASRNQIGAWMEGTYVYTFATPNVTMNAASRNSNGFENIFNVVNPRDMVTGVPFHAGFWKYGITLAFPAESKVSGQADHRSGYIAAFDREFRTLTGLHPGIAEGGVNPHMLDVYWAWLHAMPPLFHEVIPGDYRRTYIAIECPVDVSVYLDGALIARIVDNVVDETLAGDIGIMVYGDRKFLMIYDALDYTLILTGTDIGSMDLTITNVDITTGEVMEQRLFQDVPLFDGKTMQSGLSAETGAAYAVQLFVVEDGEIVDEVAPSVTINNVPLAPPEQLSPQNQQPLIVAVPEGDVNMSMTLIWAAVGIVLLIVIIIIAASREKRTAMPMYAQQTNPRPTAPPQPPVSETRTGSMYCDSCGTKFTDDSRFCRICGKERV